MRMDRYFLLPASLHETLSPLALIYAGPVGNSLFLSQKSSFLIVMEFTLKNFVF
jgi:hypothetical protein